MILTEIYKKINPLFEPTSKDVEAENKIIKELGEIKATQIAEYSVKIQGEKFAPIITSQAQLLYKLSKLIVYAKKQQNKQVKII